LAGGDLGVFAKTTALVRRPVSQTADAEAPKFPGELSPIQAVFRLLDRFRVSFFSIVLCFSTMCLLVYLQIGR
jgi:hypothetical protein